jgi:RHS repeat-associated protein
MRSNIQHAGFKACIVAVFLTTFYCQSGAQTVQSKINAPVLSSPRVSDQSTTRLPNGDLLFLGGKREEGAVSVALLENPQTSEWKLLAHGLLYPRYGHTATLLPDGKVLVFGGFASDGKIESHAELFDPDTLQFSVLPSSALTPRAYHTATILTDGQLLVAGGVDGDGETTGTLELWNFQTNVVKKLTAVLRAPRSKHTATLQGDGTVLIWGGLDNTASTLSYGEVFDPTTSSISLVTSQPVNSNSTHFTGSFPEDGTTGVTVNSLAGLRFSGPLNVKTVNGQTVVLSGTPGSILTKIVPVEGGRLIFLSPQSVLPKGSKFTVKVDGVADLAGAPIPSFSITFTTLFPASVPPRSSQGSDDSEFWIPTLNNFQQLWASGHGDSPFQRLPPLKSNPGVTALAGQSLRLNGLPLSGATLQIDDEKTTTDGTGRFLLQNLTAGHHTLLIDGSTANTDTVTYGVFEVGVDLAAGKTTALSYTIWMTRLDMAHAVTIPSPTNAETIVSTPLLPGLELHLPPQTVIYDRNGKTVKQISITPVPIDQAPFPLPLGVNVPIYFTIQPGDAYIDVQGNSWAKGAQLYYPNSHHSPPGTSFDFWNYDPDQKGWYIYGAGAVSKTGSQIIPNPGVTIYKFTGAMVGSPNYEKGQGPTCLRSICKGGEPVDLSSGLFIYDKTDLTLPDVIPVTLERTYTADDSLSRSFGIGAMANYDMFIVGDVNPYTYIELMLPNGARIRFYRTSSGTSYTNAVYTHTASQTMWYGATISYNPGAVFPATNWVLTTRDGTSYYFPEGLNQSNPLEMALLGIRDRHGNLVTVSRDSSGNITQVTSPNGRYITFQHDSSDRITQAQDNIGRTVTYTYDTGGRLASVTDANGGVTSYTYDSNNNMLTVKDARGIVYLTNQYDTNGRVSKQTMADGSTYQFTWVVGSSPTLKFAASGSTAPGPSGVMSFRGCGTCYEGYPSLVAQADMTDPRGIVREEKFDPNSGQLTSNTYALGLSDQQAFTYTYYPDNLLESSTDPLGRVTNYAYDASANTTQLTQLYGTPDSVTASFSYDPTFSQLTSATDPLGLTTSFGIDIYGNTTSITDPLGHKTSLGYTTQGQPVSVTDAAGNVTQFQYTLGDLTGTTDALGRTTQRFLDAAGRLVSTTNPTGQTTKYAYDNLNEITTVTDPLNGQTGFTYDPNGNLLSVTDANAHSTTYTYDNMDRVATHTDPLTHTESYQYDGNGNLTQFTDRRGEVTTYSYDDLDRRTFAGFGTQAGPSYASTISNTYDAGNRLTQATDSITGTITHGYDDLDRMTSETTPQGSIAYAFDEDNRRTSMTVGGQSAVSYSYDNAGRLTGITQGSSAVSFAYDPDNRRTSTTLPNGVVMSYGYDANSELTSIGYQLGQTSLGNLTYSYDLDGRRTGTGGSLAAVTLPSAVSTAAYNADNQLTQWGANTLSYDLNGNTSNDGTNSYVWDERNQLASMNMGSASFQYDPFGRRIGKTILSATTDYLYDGVNSVQELSGATPTANLLTGLNVDERFERTDATGAANYLTDALGSTIALTNSSGSTITQYTYEPFGNVSITGSSSNNYQFTGREDDGTGLEFNRARYYDALIGRFISEDPSGFGGGDVDLYVYVSDNPTTFLDPLGLNPVELDRSAPDYVTFTLGGGLITAGGGSVTINLHNGNTYWGGWADGGVQAGPSASLMFGKLKVPLGNPSASQVDAFIGGVTGYHCGGALMGVCIVRNGSGTAYQGGFMTPALIGGLSFAGRACHHQVQPTQPEPLQEPPVLPPPDDVPPCTPGECVNQPNYGLPPGGYHTSS